ncbi:uncharacterized protein LOC126844696 [Adelges cooleyi]|uniref:uncharacterized protein LOC126844696 n=1 Tax=Adelges cooleyi TaxID=133065 RepID=UPI00217F8FFD|nr:uncharacterized protein LOC126844696 [Adelges cooleyi]
MVRDSECPRTFYCLFYSYALFTANLAAESVAITELRVPSTVPNGTKGVVLDCMYNIKENETAGLVITWYFNDSPTPSYQWIPDQAPRSLGPLRKRIQLDYAVTNNPLTKHRALYIIQPTIELTGNFKCVVSTYKDEDFMFKRMIVYAADKNMQLYRSISNRPSKVNISCSADAVFPMPVLRLFRVIEGEDGKPRNDSLMIDQVDYQIKGAYYITVYTMIPETQLPSKTMFYCELEIPYTPYRNAKKFFYNPGNSESLQVENLTSRNQFSKTIVWTMLLARLYFTLF